METLFIRTDASAEIGTGHLMRTIALGQAWQDGGGHVVFLCSEITTALQQRLTQEGFGHHAIQACPGTEEDLAATRELLRHLADNGEWVVIDGYHFSGEFQRGLKTAGFRVLAMDDYGHADFYHADLVLNQNISAHEDLYRNRSPETRLLLGCEFLLLRREFLKYRGWSRALPDVARKILVSLGGADLQNVTRRVIGAISALQAHVKVVVGGSNPHLANLSEFVEESGPAGARIELVVDPVDMPGLMAWADLAVAAGGSTSYEMACMGLPCISIIVAENQVPVALGLTSRGASLCVGWDKDNSTDNYTEAVTSLMHDRHRLSDMSRSARSLVDFEGASRVLSEIRRGAAFASCA